MSIAFEEVTFGHESLSAVWKLRIDAWEAADLVGVPATDEDEHDRHALHIVGRLDDKVVAAARVCIHARLDDLPDRACLATAELDAYEAPYAHLGRRVVHPATRGLGAGATLTVLRLAAARRHGARTAICTSRTRWRAGYERLGFKVVGVAPAASIPAWKVPDEPHLIYTRALDTE